MKRSPLKRKGYLRRKSAKSLLLTSEAKEFRKAVLARAKGVCERCQESGHPHRLHAHHLVSRAQGIGWINLHNPYVNGAALCRACHAAVHFGSVNDRALWIKRRPNEQP